MNKKDIKRVRLRNVHVFVEQPSTSFTPRTGEKRLFNSLRDLIGLVSAGAGIFVALLYLAGRSFASGYFSAMNIPDYQVGFSLWEYGEVAWRPMMFYPAFMLLASSLLGFVVYAFLDLLKVVRDWLKKIIKIKWLAWHCPEISLQTRHWFNIALFAFLIILFIYSVDSTLQFVKAWGSTSGQISVLEKAAQVELISSVPMAFENVSVVTFQSSGQNFYAYKDFHLLTFNDGKYYLFQDIDPATCKPRQVYVINDDQSMQVYLFPAVSLTNQCQMNLGRKLIATPTAISSAGP